MTSRDGDSTAEYSSLAEELAAKSVDSTKQKSEVNLLAKAVALLSSREYSEKGLREKLQRYTDDLDAINAVISRLQRENWQSDERFVETFVQSREHRWGNQKILQALSQHDLDSEQLGELKEDLRTRSTRERVIYGLSALVANTGLIFMMLRIQLIMNL
ncbi:Regulatory protein RecX [Oligella ureolytica]